MEDRFNLNLHRSFFRSPSEKTSRMQMHANTSRMQTHANTSRMQTHANTSRMQSTQTQWLYALITGKNFAAHVNWMNGKKSDAFARRCSVKKVF